MSEITIVVTGDGVQAACVAALIQRALQAEMVFPVMHDDRPGRFTNEGLRETILALRDAGQPEVYIRHPGSPGALASRIRVAQAVQDLTDTAAKVRAGAAGDKVAAWIEMSVRDLTGTDGAEESTAVTTRPTYSIAKHVDAHDAAVAVTLLNLRVSERLVAEIDALAEKHGTTRQEIVANARRVLGGADVDDAAVREAEKREAAAKALRELDLDARQRAASSNYMAPGCCSAATPCGHQKRWPATLCVTCEAAQRTTRARETTSEMYRTSQERAKQCGHDVCKSSGYCCNFHARHACPVKAPWPGDPLPSPAASGSALDKARNP